MNPKLNVTFRSLGLYSTDGRKFALFVTKELHGKTCFRKINLSLDCKKVYIREGIEVEM